MNAPDVNTPTASGITDHTEKRVTVIEERRDWLVVAAAWSSAAAR